MEAEENLEETNHLKYNFDQQQMIAAQYSKTPNVKGSKFANNAKMMEITKNGMRGLKADNSMPKIENRNVNNRSKNKYSIGDNSSFVLPTIKESHGAVIFDRKKLDLLMKDIDDTSSVAKVSNTYKQSYNIF